MRPASAKPLAILSCLLPCLAVFALYLLAFFPGLFSEDSYILWRQITGGAPPASASASWYRAIFEQPFNSFLPFANTLACWLVTRLWSSPAAICILQGLALSCAFAYAVLRLKARGLPAWAGAAILAAFAAFPLHGFYVVTLWKDVLYSAALLWLTVLVLEVAVPGPAAGPPGRKGAALLALAAASVWLGRPNGPAPVLLTFAGLLLACPEARRPLLGAAVLAAAIVFLVKVPLSRAMGENHEGEGFYKASPFIFDIGAVLHEGGSISDRDKATLAQFQDIDEWRDGYHPYLFPYWRSRHASWMKLDDPALFRQLLRAWSSIAWDNPGIVLRHRVRAASVGWRLGIAVDALYVIPADRVAGGYLPHRPEPSEVGQSVRDPAPALTRWMTALANSTILSPRWSWLFAQPAGWIYLTILFAAFCAWRTRSARLAVVFIPVISNWLATMAFCMAQDVRYFYPGFLVAPIAAGLALLSARSSEAVRVGHPGVLW